MTLERNLSRLIHVIHVRTFFFDTMLSEMQCIVSCILTAVYVSFLCLERAGACSLALCLFSSFVADVMHV